MSYKEVVFTIKPPPHSWVKDLLKFRLISIKILDCKSIDDIKVSEVFEIKCDPYDIYSLVDTLNNSKYVDNMEVINIDRKNGVVIGIVKTSHCTVCKLFSSSSDCFLGSAVYEVNNNCVKWRLISHINLIRKLVERIREYGVEIDIDSISSVRVDDKSPELTLKQEEILKLAWKRGLFDFPRKTTLIKLSELLNLSPATVSECLRSGLRKILKTYFESSSGTLVKRSKK